MWGDVHIFPTVIATKLQPLLVDPAGSSHLYTKMAYVRPGQTVLAFEIPAWTGEGSLWTQMRFTSSRRTSVSAELNILANDKHVAIGMATGALAPAFGVEHREWTPLPWAIPTAALEQQTLFLRIDLGEPVAGIEREEYVSLELLGFEHLYPPHKTEFVLSDKKGTVSGRFLFGREASGVLSEATSASVSQALLHSRGVKLCKGVYVPTSEQLVDEFQRHFLLPLATL
jgi:hypothetical protein